MNSGRQVAGVLGLLFWALVGQAYGYSYPAVGGDRGDPLVDWHGVKGPEAKPLWDIGGVEFYPYLRLSLTYDDNVFYANKDKESDLIWHVTPGLHLRRQRVKWGLGLDYQASAVCYAEFADENTFEHRGALVLNWENEGLCFGFRDELCRPSDPLLSEAPDTPSRLERWENLVEAHASYRKRFLGELTVRHQYVDYDSRELDLLQRSELGGVVAAGYQLRGETALVLRGGYGLVNWGGDALNDFTRGEVTAGVSNPLLLNQRLKAALRIGLGFAAADDEVRRVSLAGEKLATSFTGFVGRLGLDWEADPERIYVHFLALREIVATSKANFGVRSTESVNLHYYFQPEVWAAVGAGLEQFDVDVDDLDASAAVFTLEGRYELTSFAGVFGRYRFRSRDTKLAGGLLDYSKSEFMLGVMLVARW